MSVNVDTSSAVRPLHYLVTGGAGFIGSHLSEALLDAGHRVTVIDNLSTGLLRNIAPLTKRPHFRFVRASICHGIDLTQHTGRADVVVHLAAAVGVELIVKQPVQTVETNINGTEQVLKAALPYGCRVLIASTSEVYGKGTKIPFSEDDDVVLGPTNRNRWAYAASKMVDEFLAFAYQQEYGLPVVAMRFFNTVGPRQTGRYGMVVPRLVRQALRGEPMTVYGDGTQSRCFSDVRDVVRAVIGLSTHPAAPGHVYNIGSTEEIEIRALARRIRAMSGSSSGIVKIPYDRAYAPGFDDMQRRVPDTRRIGRLLSWAPTFSLDQTLATIIESERSRTTVDMPQSGQSSPPETAVHTDY